MNKIKLTTNKGKVFDTLLNAYLNFILWIKGINEKNAAVKESAKQINTIKRVFRI